MFSKINLVKDFRLLVLVLLVLTSVFLLSTSYISKRSGVVVSSILDDSKCKILRNGNVITQISGYEINDVKDFENALSYVRSGEYVTMVVNNGPSGCVATKDGYLGIVVEDMPSKKLRFSIDIQGGYVTKFKLIEETSESNIEKIADILNKRIEILGFVETKAYSSDGAIDVISSEPSEFSFLTKPCKFVGSIEQKIIFENGTGNIGVGNESYKVELLDENNVMVNNLLYSIDKEFMLQDIIFNIKNISTNFTQIDGIVATNNDTSKTVGYGGVNFDPNSRVYYINEPIILSLEASERFVKLTKPINSVFEGGQFILTAPFTFYIDDELISKLNIPRSIAGNPIQSISLLIHSNDVNEVLNKKMIVDVCLGSNRLPVDIEKIDVKKIESSFSDQTKVFLVVLPIVVMVSVVFLNLFYKKSIKLVLWGMILSIMEIVILLGIISFTQIFSKYIWVIDIPTLLGFITVFSVTLIKMSYLTIYQKSVEQELNKVKLFLIFLIDKLEIIFVLIAFALLFTIFKGFGLTAIISTILWTMLIKYLYLSKFRQM